MNKNKKIKILIIAGYCILACLFSYAPKALAAEPNVGAVNNWFNLSEATTLSVDMRPIYGKDGFHFYSLAPFFQNQSYGLYSGIQTNGNIGGVAVGNTFIFSVWNATVAFPENGVTATPFDGEGIGYSLRKAYNWNVGDTYAVNIKRESFDTSNNGYRWSAAIKHKESGTSLKLGEIVAPNGANSLSSGSIFHERFAGTTPVCSQTESNLEKAGVTFSNLSSDKSVAFNGVPAPNNIFSSVGCDTFTHFSSDSTTAKTGFGLTISEFNNPIIPTAPVTEPTEPTPTVPETQPTVPTPTVPTTQPTTPTTNTKTDEKPTTNSPTNSTESPTADDSNSTTSRNTSTPNNNINFLLIGLGVLAVIAILSTVISVMIKKGVFTRFRRNKQSKQNYSIPIFYDPNPTNPTEKTNIPIAPDNEAQILHFQQPSDIQPPQQQIEPTNILNNTPRKYL